LPFLPLAESIGREGGEEGRRGARRGKRGGGHVPLPILLSKTLSDLVVELSVVVVGVRGKEGEKGREKMEEERGRE